MLEQIGKDVAAEPKTVPHVTFKDGSDSHPGRTIAADQVDSVRVVCSGPYTSFGAGAQPSGHTCVEQYAFRDCVCSLLFECSPCVAVWG